MTYDPAASTLRSFHAALPDFEKGTSTPRDFLEGCIEEVESREDSLKAFVVADWEKARQAADAASKRYRDGSVLSAIDGFPVGVKDIIETRDFPTQMNSPIYTGWQSRRRLCAWSAAGWHRTARQDGHHGICLRGKWSDAKSA